MKLPRCAIASHVVRVCFGASGSQRYHSDLTFRPADRRSRQPLPAGRLNPSMTGIAPGIGQSDQTLRLAAPGPICDSRRRARSQVTPGTEILGRVTSGKQQAVSPQPLEPPCGILVEGGKRRAAQAGPLKRDDTIGEVTALG